MKIDPAQELYANRNKSIGLEKSIDTYAIWSFGLTISQFILLGLWFLFPIFMILSVVGIILGALSLGRISKNSDLKGRGFAIAGIIIGVLQLIGYIILIVFLLRAVVLSAA